MDERYIVIFDGVCNFCDTGVNFIIKRDPEHKFVFTPMQSDVAKALIKQHLPDMLGVDTFILLKNEKIFIRSDAALEIIKDLSGAWYSFVVFKIVPRTIRDFIYKLVAKRRYKLFGKSERCRFPSDEERSRFIE